MVLWLTFTHHFLYLLVLIFLLTFSTGYSKENKSTISTGIDLQMHTNDKQIMHQGVREKMGRKMMSRRFWKVLETQHWNNIAEASSSSSTFSDGEAEDVKERIRGVLNNNVRRKLSKTRRRRSMRVKNMSAGFVSWNADYHVPRLHPPKNN